MDLMEKLREVDNKYKATRRPIYGSDMQQVVPQTPVTEEDSEVIKKTYSTNPEVHQAPIDIQNIQQQARALSPGPTGTEMALGAIPVAMSLLMGGGGAGAEVAAPYMTGLATDSKKRTQNLEDKLLDLELKKRAKAAEASSSTGGKNRYIPTPYVDEETGETVLGSFDRFENKYTDIDGNPLSGKFRRGFSRNAEARDKELLKRFETSKATTDYRPRTDPTTGGLARIEDNRLSSIQDFSEKLSPKEEKDLTGLMNQFKTTDTFKRPVSSLALARNVDRLLTSARNGNATAANSVKTPIARMSGEVGSMSDSDIERAGGSTALKEKAKRLANLERSGVPMTARDIDEAFEVAKVYANEAARALQEAEAGLEESFVSNYGGRRGAAGRALRALIPQLPEGLKETFPRTLRKGGKQVTVKNEKELREANADGWN